MPTLALVRHGQSLWNLENRFTGWVDVPLTEQGRARRPAPGASSCGATSFAVAYTSTLQRAQETLDIILETMGVTDMPIIRDEALNERHYGDLQGLNKAPHGRAVRRRAGPHLAPQLRDRPAQRRVARR